MRVFREEIFGPVLVATAVRRRGRGDPARERDGVRPRRLRVDAATSARAPRRARDRHRAVLDQLPERARPAHAVRRRQGRAASAARAATTRSSSTASSRPSTSRSAAHHIPRLGLSSRATEARRGPDDRHRARADDRRSTSCAARPSELVVTDLAALASVLRRPARPHRHRGDRRRALPARRRGAPASQPRAAQGAEPPPSHLAFRVRSAGRPRRARAAFDAELGCDALDRRGGRARSGHGRSFASRIRSASRSSSSTRWSTSSACSSASTCIPGRASSALDHFNLYVPDVAPAYELLQDARVPLHRIHRKRRGHRAARAWICRKPTVHDTALTSGAAARGCTTRLHAPSRLRRHGRATSSARAPVPTAIERGPGATASRTPSSCTCATRTVTASSSTPATTTPATPTRADSAGAHPTRGAEDYWGSTVPDSWFEEGTSVASWTGRSRSSPRRSSTSA